MLRMIHEAYSVHKAEFTGNDYPGCYNYLVCNIWKRSGIIGLHFHVGYKFLNDFGNLFVLNRMLQTLDIYWGFLS